MVSFRMFVGMSLFALVLHTIHLNSINYVLRQDNAVEAKKYAGYFESVRVHVVRFDAVNKTVHSNDSFIPADKRMRVLAMKVALEVKTDDVIGHTGCKTD